jgi:hypothetical protein
MKYMIMMYGSAGAMIESRSEDWITDMIKFMRELDVELRSAGELVEARGLADPDLARVVHRGDDGPTVTTGPYSTSGESLIGYWVVDVATDARLLEIADSIVTYSGQVELRPVLDGPPDV